MTPNTGSMLADEMSIRDVVTEHAVIDFFREEIRNRYQLDRMRQRTEFQSIPDGMLEAIRNFILDRIYPSSETRGQMEPDLEHLSALLCSPIRVGTLLRSNVMSVVRIGVHLPAAISAGLTIVDTLRATGDLETSMMEEAYKLKVSPDNADPKLMLQIIARVPERAVRKVIDGVGRLFDTLSDTKMLKGVLRLLENCLRTMEAHPDDYTVEERRGMTLALDTLKAGHALFTQVPAKDFPQIVKGIASVESAWYESVRV